MNKHQISRAREASRRNKAARLKAEKEEKLARENPTQKKRVSDADKLEGKVYALLEKHFPRVLKGVYVYVNADRVSEIDIILFHSSGIYIFESKAKKKVILGSPKDTYWTAVHGENTRSRFYNPMKQTEGQAKKLSRKFNISPLACNRVIVFPSNADISRVRFNSSHTMLCTLDELIHVINGIKNNKTEPLSPFLLDNIYWELEATQGDKIYQQKHREAINRAGSRMHMKSRMDLRSR